VRPHIVIYSALYAQQGGVEANIIQLVAGLRDQFRFSVLSAGSSSFAAAVQAAGAAFCPLPHPPPRAFSPPAIRALAKHLKNEHRADLIHTVDPRGSTIGCPAGRLARIPVVHRYSISPQDFENQTPARHAWYALGEAALGWLCIDAGIFVSQNMQRRGWLPAQRGHYIPNSVPFSHIEPARPTPADAFLWVHVGRLTRQKGADVLLAAAAQLPPQPAWRLLIIGEGELHPALLAAGEKLGGRVLLMGALPRPQVWRIVAAADGFVLPSRYEGMPNALLEALSLGVPSVVTDVGDSWFLVGGGALPPAGLCVGVDDAAGLAAAMQEMMTKPDLLARFKAACAARAAPFSPGRTLGATAALYTRLIESRTPPPNRA